MSLETEHYCPVCEDEQTFWRTASTTIHLGEKIKWACAECDYGFVTVNETIDTSVSA
jgi:rubredoxin